jgi:lysozyme
VGITSMSGHRVERYIDNPQPLTKCLAVWVWLMETKYMEDVEKAFGSHELRPHEVAAALSFHWNTGAIKKASWVNHYLSGHLALAKAAFMRYNQPKEIIPRRQKECVLFFGGKWSAEGTMTEYQVTSRHTPAWGSARKINVTQELEGLLNA